MRERRLIAGLDRFDKKRDNGHCIAYPQTYDALDTFLREQLETLGIPGAAIAVVRDGVQVHSAAFGRADDSGRPMTAQTPMLLASTSKSRITGPKLGFRQHRFAVVP